MVEVEEGGEEDTGFDGHVRGDDGHDDADDEDEGSHTHVGEGSNGYKEFVGFQGYEAPRRDEGRYGYDGTDEYEEDMHDGRHHEYEGDMHDDRPHDDYEDSHEHDDEMQGEGGDYGHEDENGMQPDEDDGHQRKEGAYGYDDSQYGEEMRHGGEGGDLQREKYFSAQPESNRGYEGELQDEDHNADEKEGDEDGAESHVDETQGEGERRSVESQSPEEREEEPEGETLPPGRVLLMERLCDLVQRLSAARVGGGMEADVIDVLNAKVDEMEDLLVLAEEMAEAEATAEVEPQDEAEEQAAAEAEVEAEAASEVGADKDLGGAETDAESATREEEAEPESGEASKSPSGRSPALPSVPLLQIEDEDIRDLASPLPWLNSTFRYSELSISPTHSNPELAAATNEALEAAKQAAQAQWDMAERIAREAEKLNLELAAVVQKLQSRKEESDVSFLLPLTAQV